jgi:hypothetical protein
MRQVFINFLPEPYFDSVQSVYIVMSCFLKICFNFLSFSRSSPKWLLSLGFSHQNDIRISHLHHIRFSCLDLVTKILSDEQHTL